MADPILDPSKTVIVYPAAGSCWPGMADDLTAEPAGRVLLQRAQEGLRSVDRPQAVLTDVLAGRDMLDRKRVDGRWQWVGDYVVSSACQTIVSVAHAQRFIARYGAPSAMIGESLGEVAGYVVAGVMSLEDAMVTLHHYAEALFEASAAANDLRLGLLLKIKRDELEALCAPHDARVVIYESMNQFVVALPCDRLDGLEADARKAKGRFLVSAQPCASHDARLATASSAWRRYKTWLDSVPMSPPTIDMMSTLDPGLVLNDVEDLRDNLLLTCTRPVHWAEAISRLFWHPEEREIDTLVQVCSKGDAYVLERLRPQGVVLAGARIEAVATLGGIDALGPAR